MIHTYLRLRATLPVLVESPEPDAHVASVLEWAATVATAEDAVAALLQDLQRAGFTTALTSGPDLPGQGVLPW